MGGIERGHFDHMLLDRAVQQRVGLFDDCVAPVGERDEEGVDGEVGDKLQTDDHKRTLS